MSVLPDDPRLSAPACLKLGSPAMVHENPWFSVMDRGGYYTVEHHTPQVVVLPVVAGHGVVMVRAHRPVIADCPLELPAGGFLAGESPRQAAARELAEETGILVDAPERFVPQSPIAGLPNRDPLLLHILRVDLNHGIGVAVGVALGLRLKGSSRRVFVVVGDGESNEGTVWEALLVAESLKLANLTVIYDNNLSHSRGLQIPNPLGKLKAFGCDTVEVPGHDLDALRAALDRTSTTAQAVVANTVKGYGCPTLIQGQYEWHRRSPDAAQLTMLMEELNAQAV